MQANPPQLHSNLAYIQRFRKQTRLVSESAYFFTNMLSVESFIMNIDAKALSLEETEFENNMESARQLLSDLSESSDANNQVDQITQHAPRREPPRPKPASSSRRHHHSPTHSQVSIESSETTYVEDQSSLNKIPSISDLENKGASMLLKEDEVNKVFRDFPFLYSQAGDLTVGDVEDLLSNYKQLVFKYVCLAKGLGVTIPSPSLSHSEVQNVEQPEVANEPEKVVTEAQRDENMQNEISKVSSDSGEESVTGLENSETKMPEEAAVDSQGGKGMKILEDDHH